MEESKNELEDFQSDNKDFSGFMCHCRKMSRNPNKYHNNDFRKIAEQIYNQLRVNPDGNIVQFSKNIKDVEEDYETIRKYSKIIGEKNKDKHLRERKNIIEQKDKDKFRNEKVLIIEDESYQVEVLLLFVKAMGFGKKNIYIISKDNREFVEIDKVQIKCLSGFPNLQDLEQYIEVIDPHYIITDDDLGQNNYKGRDLFDSYPNIILVSAQDLSGVLPTKINFIMKSVPYKILEAKLNECQDVLERKDTEVWEGWVGEKVDGLIRALLEVRERLREVINDKAYFARRAAGNHKIIGPKIEFINIQRKAYSSEDELEI